MSKKRKRRWDGMGQGRGGKLGGTYDDVVDASNGKHVGDHYGSARGGDRARFGPVLLLLALLAIWEIGQDGGDATCRGDLTRIDHDEQLHNVVIGRDRARLDDEDILVADRNA
ncbi:hypothetical protein BC936DRAFT_149016 [Jimgerdemannia flammicorona]|uniref:Uncharacterized protein n=1 Tax=Jimgerdemannia flammicorona TaxID=994334 RepID=A0A433D1U0_9FUNG|nr:hypothetical protein BC936DRAFT_149016 [Jimgerdemannia flammicorona]